MSLAMIGDFTFEMNDASFQNINESFSFGWSRNERLYNHPVHMKKNLSSHKLTVSGTLILKKVYALDALIAVADRKEPVEFVILDNDRVFWVVITDLTIDKDVFLETGVEVRKKFSLKMERYYER